MPPGRRFLFFRGGGSAQPFFTPYSAEFLVVHHETFAAHHHMGLAPPQARMTPSEPPQPATQLHILGRFRPGRSALG